MPHEQAVPAPTDRPFRCRDLCFLSRSFRPPGLDLGTPEMNPAPSPSSSHKLPLQLATISGLCTLLLAGSWACWRWADSSPSGWLLAGSVLLMAALAARLGYTLTRRVLATPAAAAAAALQPAMPALGGEEKDVTILFCDIRRFTALAEEMPAPQVVELLNTFFSRMIQVVLAHGGTVDKLMGDSVMALFGVPQAEATDPLRAVRCALEMHRALAELNRERARLDQPPIEMGIGINSGPVVAGNIGSIDRMDYTVIGDNVNIAARLQGIAEAGDTLVSEATHNKVREMVRASALPPAQLKGRQHQVAVFRIEGLRPNNNLQQR